MFLERIYDPLLSGAAGFGLGAGFFFGAGRFLDLFFAGFALRPLLGVGGLFSFYTRPLRSGDRFKTGLLCSRRRLFTGALALKLFSFPLGADNFHPGALFGLMVDWGFRHDHRFGLEFG